MQVVSRTIYYIGFKRLCDNCIVNSKSRLATRCLNSTSSQGESVDGGRWKGLRRLWRNWFPIPTGVGLALLATLQWRNINNRNKPAGEKPVTVLRQWEITCYRCIPLRAASRCFGWLTECSVPPLLRSLIYRSYATVFSVNLDEMADDLLTFPTFSAFFTRRLKAGVRPVDLSQAVVSPADGHIVNVCRVTSCKVDQVKGVTYNLHTFLGDPTWRALNGGDDISQAKQTYPGSILVEEGDLRKRVQRATDENDNKIGWKAELTSGPVLVQWGLFAYIRSMLNWPDPVVANTGALEPSWPDYKRCLLHCPDNELYQVVIYLAPGDYHRFHSPAHWTVLFRRHFQGELLSVNPRVASWVPELFSLNERVTYVGEWEHGFFSMTPVGATNVGSIKVYGDKALHTNQKWWRGYQRHKDRFLQMFWRKGEEIGEFRLGSTIVLMFEAPPSFRFSVSPGEKIRVGEAMCCQPVKETRPH